MSKKKYRPVEPINKKKYEQLGLSIDPRDLPREKMGRSILVEKVEELSRAKNAAVKAAEDEFDNTHGRGRI